MRRVLLLFALGALALLPISCQNQAPQPAPAAPGAVLSWTVPQELLPREGLSSPEWQVRALRDYVSAHLPAWKLASKTGDDDQPSVASCSNQGPPQCWDAYGDVGFCKDACGGVFWTLAEDDVCVGAMTGNVYRCDGRAH